MNFFQKRYFFLDPELCKKLLYEIKIDTSDDIYNNLPKNEGADLI